ncbi:lipoate--protein ligase family protein [Anthocerotibacter panamensis]|uniref:lipoate--protein ligase family protein n=1 Tax=Anthocerotibacter panamensis TaxID=2857077 RepID=UPI001C4088CE|nr:hypothetical protein [Anthocerotibacter panamensis]
MGPCLDITLSGTGSWYSLPTVYGPGSEHMARDEALLELHRVGRIPSIFYLSVWTPPALSLGYHQRRVPAGTWDVPQVKRPTGGRAVWHRGDITYTLVTSGLQGGILQTYAQLSQVLIHGLAQLGVDLAPTGARDGNYQNRESCFAHRAAVDLCWQGYKVIGSAQLRRGQALLQQGSILLEPDYAQLAALFPSAPLPIKGLKEILGYSPTPEALHAAIGLGIRAVFGTAVAAVAWECLPEAQKRSSCLDRQFTGLENTQSPPEGG